MCGVEVKTSGGGAAAPPPVTPPEMNGLHCTRALEPPEAEEPRFQYMYRTSRPHLQKLHMGATPATTLSLSPRPVASIPSYEGIDAHGTV